ncbi:acyl carrier protein [Priestia megaterium]
MAVNENKEEKKTEYDNSKAEKIAQVVMQQVQEILSSNLLKNFNVMSRFVEDLCFDELEIYELIYRIENKFKVAIPESVAEDFTSPIDLIGYLNIIIREPLNIEEEL